MELALVIVAASEDGPEHHRAGVARRALAASHVVDTIDLVAEEVTPAMSRSERLHYETSTPLLDQTIETHADLVSRAATLVFVFPTVWWTPPPVLQAWLERTFVPGVAFQLDERHRLRPNLHALRAIVGITSHYHPEVMADGGDGARRILLRTMRLNAPRRIRTGWLVDPDDAQIDAELGKR
ncbi:MAG: NAD(P)H-dependent oxidoreductase [Acidimicrobiia bacterium]|nr:NAD(P)H-dependent oxidoreductase [Acidimicrobiia bacterium]